MCSRIDMKTLGQSRRPYAQ